MTYKEELYKFIYVNPGCDGVVETRYETKYFVVLLCMQRRAKVLAGLVKIEQDDTCVKNLLLGW